MPFRIVEQNAVVGMQILAHLYIQRPLHQNLSFHKELVIY